MKHLIITLITLFSVAAFARVDVNNDNSILNPGLPVPETFTELVKISPQTRVLKVHFESRWNVSCPGEMDLVSQTRGQNVEVKFDSSRFDIINSIRRNVSNSCAKEIWDLEFNPNKVTCLSYGKEWGTLYIPVPRTALRGGIVEITHPFNIEIIEVTELAEL